MSGELVSGPVPRGALLLHHPTCTWWSPGWVSTWAGDLPGDLAAETGTVPPLVTAAQVDDQGRSPRDCSSWAPAGSFRPGVLPLLAHLTPIGCPERALAEGKKGHGGASRDAGRQGAPTVLVLRAGPGPMWRPGRGTTGPSLELLLEQLLPGDTLMV